MLSQICVSITGAISAQARFCASSGCCTRAPRRSTLTRWPPIRPTYSSRVLSRFLVRSN
jgi:hypothetical protein